MAHSCLPIVRRQEALDLTQVAGIFMIISFEWINNFDQFKCTLDFLIELIFNQTHHTHHTRCSNSSCSLKQFYFSIFFMRFLYLFPGSPSILTSPPPSPSCSHPTANSDVFFPRSNSTSSGSSSSSSSNLPQTPSSIRMHDDYRSARATVPRRRYIFLSFFHSFILSIVPSSYVGPIFF